MRVWSYSSLNLFATCPRQYYLTKVINVIPYTETVSTRWGSEVHLAMENFLNGEAELADKYADFRPFAEKVLSLPGERFVEREFALDRNLHPTDFEAADAWCRGVIDVGVINGRKALVGDWKTGKIRPDSDQLKLFAAFVMHHYPEVETVKTAYVWLAHGTVTAETYTREDLSKIWQHFMAKAARLEAAYEKDRWVPKTSGLCNGWCGAGETHCEYWKPRRK